MSPRKPPESARDGSSGPPQDTAPDPYRPFNNLPPRKHSSAQGPSGTSVAEVTSTAAIRIAALAGDFQGWALSHTNIVERWMLIVAGFALVCPSMGADLIGFGR